MINSMSVIISANYDNSNRIQSSNSEHDRNCKFNIHRFPISAISFVSWLRSSILTTIVVASVGQSLFHILSINKFQLPNMYSRHQKIQQKHKLKFLTEFLHKQLQVFFPPNDYPNQSKPENQ